MPIVDPQGFDALGLFLLHQRPRCRPGIRGEQRIREPGRGAGLTDWFAGRKLDPGITETREQRIRELLVRGAGEGDWFAGRKLDPFRSGGRHRWSRRTLVQLERPRIDAVVSSGEEAITRPTAKPWLVANAPPGISSHHWSISLGASVVFDPAAPQQRVTSAVRKRKTVWYGRIARWWQPPSPSRGTGHPFVVFIRLLHHAVSHRAEQAVQTLHIPSSARCNVLVSMLCTFC